MLVIYEITKAWKHIYIYVYLGTLQHIHDNT